MGVPDRRLGRTFVIPKSGNVLGGPQESYTESFVLSLL